MEVASQQIDQCQGREHIDGCLEESMDSEGDEDSLVLIAENLQPHYTYNPSGTNTIYTVFLIVNAALGAGLLNFPKSYDNAGGIVVAIIVQTVLLVFIVIALLSLAYAADRCESGAAKTIQVRSLI